ncbi:MAG: hypothetical protein FWE67_12515 [Planctomycetaceae bacterium]|nr:hypothetical protein [Planctomycetaceae bacterium]
MSRKIVCFLFVSFIALAAVNFTAAEEQAPVKYVVAEGQAVVPAAPCDCVGPVVHAPYWGAYPYYRYYRPYYGPYCGPVCDPCYPPVFYRRGILGHYRPFYAW